MLRSAIRVAAALACVFVLLLPASALFVAMFPYHDTAPAVLWLLFGVLPALLWVSFHDYSLERLAVFAIAAWLSLFALAVPIRAIQWVLSSVGLLPRSSLLVAGVALAVVYYVAYVAVYRGGYERAKRWMRG